MKSTLFEHVRHPHTPHNVNALHDGQMSAGNRIADQVAAFIGSWRFIIGQGAMMAVWVVVNTLVFFHVFQFDAYPFVFLYLAMSAEAAFSAPIIMMSQNRQAAKDRLIADETHSSALKDEEETRQVMEHLMAQDAELLKQTQELLRHTKLLLSLVPLSRREP